MPHVSIGDADIYYEEQGRGPTLMLVPGLGGQGAFWGPQVGDFARDCADLVRDGSAHIFRRLTGLRTDLGSKCAQRRLQLGDVGA